MNPLRTFQALAALFFLALLLSCDESRALADAGRERLMRGDYDTALEIYEEAYRARPNNPRALAGLGELLSLRRISLFSGLELMQESLSIEPDAALRERLALIYAAMERFDLARALVDPSKMSVQEVYSEPVQLLHAGLDCLKSPGPIALRRLQARPRSPRRDYFLALCQLKLATPQNKDEAMKALLSIGDAEIACETAALWNVEYEPEPGWLRRANSECQRRFKGNLALFRERPPIVPPQPATSGRTLYGRSVFETQDPGAERDTPDYRFGNRPTPYEPPPDTPDQWGRPPAASPP
ncbi:MAG: tetratricopeptide repeat protein [Leptospirales bacterium]|nr:tetratricopeptide repeat protein [Leptospirales bacterium]